MSRDKDWMLNNGKSRNVGRVGIIARDRERMELVLYVLRSSTRRNYNKEVGSEGK